MQPFFPFILGPSSRLLIKTVIAAPQDLINVLHEVRANGVEKSDGARILNKNVGAQIWAKHDQNGSKMKFSPIFLLIAHQILKLRIMIESDNI